MIFTIDIITYWFLTWNTEHEYIPANNYKLGI